MQLSQYTGTLGTWQEIMQQPHTETLAARTHCHQQMCCSLQYISGAYAATTCPQNMANLLQGRHCTAPVLLVNKCVNSRTPQLGSVAPQLVVLRHILILPEQQRQHAAASTDMGLSTYKVCTYHIETQSHNTNTAWRNSPKQCRFNHARLH